MQEESINHFMKLQEVEESVETAKTIQLTKAKLKFSFHD